MNATAWLHGHRISHQVHMWEILEWSLTTVIQTEYFLVDGIGTLGESVTSSTEAGLEAFSAETTLQAHFICHSSVCKLKSQPSFIKLLWEASTNTHWNYGKISQKSKN